MASPAIVTEGRPYAKFWREFQAEVRRQVNECNTVAGDALWILGAAAEGGERITVASVKREEDRVECALDEVLGLINCTHDTRGLATTFRLRCADGLFVNGENARTVEEASAFVLGQLVGGEEA